MTKKTKPVLPNPPTFREYTPAERAARRSTAVLNGTVKIQPVATVPSPYVLSRRHHLLIIAMEECAEVAQRISKALRFGLDEIQTGQTLDNAERILVEWADLLAVMDELKENKALPDAPSFMESCIRAKKLKLKEFLGYSKQIGTLGSD